MWTARGGKESGEGSIGRRQNANICVCSNQLISKVPHTLLLLLLMLLVIFSSSSLPFFSPSICHLSLSSRPCRAFSFASSFYPAPPSLPPSHHSPIPSPPLCLLHYHTISVLYIMGITRRDSSQIIFLCPPLSPIATSSHSPPPLSSFWPLPCLKHTHDVELIPSTFELTVGGPLSPGVVER